jgi:hypothetical protein
MRIVEQTNRYVIVAVNESYGTDYYVYRADMTGDPKVCPSLSMARSVAAGY